MTAEEWRAHIDDAKHERAAAGQVYRAARTKATTADADYYAAEEAQQVIQAVAEHVQEAAHDRIAAVVSRCLAAVFDEPYEFRINFERTRGRTEARLVFVRGGEAVSPLDSSGGGVVDVAAFALRTSCLMLSRPPARRVMVLDEPFRFVSAGYRARVAAMLEGLATDLSIQFIMVTHIDELRCGEVVEVL
jgi:DNA repair exonuclease SbcCD ATPase subunit